MTVKVLIYPRGSNPYQELLYTRFKTSEYLVKYLDSASRSHVLGLIILPLQLIYYRVVGYTVFHIHWLHTFQLYQNLKIFHNLPFKIVYTGYFYFVFLLIRILNYKIVWTAHDLVARQNQFVNNLSISRFLASISDAVIVHSRKSISEMEIMQIKPRKVCVIPIGNYCNAYPNTVTKSKARKLLGIKPSTFVYGHFGRIEYYKGVLELIDAFSVINLTDIKLVIAGPCTDPDLYNIIIKLAERDKRILFFPKYVPENEVQNYLNSSDVMVYPFREITTSSSIILSMSFMRMCICPYIGDITEIPKHLGFFYTQSNGQYNLRKKMISAYFNKEKLARNGVKCYTYTQKTNWIDSAKMTENLYSQIMV